MREQNLTTMNSIAVAHAFAFTVRFKEDDDGDVKEEIENCCNVIGIPFNQNEINRVHSAGKPFLDKERKRKVRSIIVKFMSWKVCVAFYKARPENHVNRRKKLDII